MRTGASFRRSSARSRDARSSASPQPFEQSEAPEPPIRGMLAYPLKSAIPVRTVASWSQGLGLRTPSSLWRRWRQTPLAAEGLRPEDFLDWTDVMRCVLMKTTWSSWKEVAEASGLSPEWLARACLRLTGTTAARCGAGSLTDRWTRAIVIPLLGHDAMIRHQTQ